jgi:hypothetical protein
MFGGLAMVLAKWGRAAETCATLSGSGRGLIWDPGVSRETRSTPGYLL